MKKVHWLYIIALLISLFYTFAGIYQFSTTDIDPIIQSEKYIEYQKRSNIYWGIFLVFSGACVAIIIRLILKSNNNGGNIDTTDD